ncbi:hypothetical protein PR202_ga16283 [Eleusine coracana subsp. coracana]|uniref:Uncharacterized protein n=1 Tax=Eleusine coracana subsp. coracana TaxID=191504 RepID=A0AAV5CMS3_ELECO|nr:hypothetical protein PR202_ga16283 [Eleusine coracana subsp. coracana]
MPSTLYDVLSFVLEKNLSLLLNASSFGIKFASSRRMEALVSVILAYRTLACS